ncbi:DUF5990 family protein [Novosphingobium sp. JCM 18896]|uniref:DUF5990 family protein n=1 Tax=Novosphingobium sp. JCM 18896 TaxID=2989731 RepID=UPI002222860B|nr:DUF5990 family protein [Novosphingobium sp. JCM 18896]MCW1430718.1 DUF5990 family protein [Novosphingobium sp. JCM 18896]
MARETQSELRMRIVIERPVVGVMHSLQDKDGHPLDPKRSAAGEPLAFDFAIRVAPGPRFFGDQVRREGPQRRFVYVRVGELAGDPASPWSRRMKLDIHDIDPDLLDRAVADGGTIELTVDGTGKDGTPACATIPVAKRLR